MEEEYVNREKIKSWKVYSNERHEYVVPIGSINLVPAADVKSVVRGCWMTKEYMYGDSGAGIIDEWVERPAERSDYYAYCSACGQDAGYDGEQSLVLSVYCPNCGAAMRKWEIQSNKEKPILIKFEEV